MVRNANYVATILVSFCQVVIPCPLLPQEPTSVMRPRRASCEAEEETSLLQLMQTVHQHRKEIATAAASTAAATTGAPTSSVAATAATTTSAATTAAATTAAATTAAPTTIAATTAAATAAASVATTAATTTAGPATTTTPPFPAPAPAQPAPFPGGLDSGRTAAPATTTAVSTTSATAPFPAPAPAQVSETIATTTPASTTTAATNSIVINVSVTTSQPAPAAFIAESSTQSRAKEGLGREVASETVANTTAGLRYTEWLDHLVERLNPAHYAPLWQPQQLSATSAYPVQFAPGMAPVATPALFAAGVAPGASPAQFTPGIAPGMAPGAVPPPAQFAARVVPDRVPPPAHMGGPGVQPGFTTLENRAESTFSIPAPMDMLRYAMAAGAAAMARQGTPGSAGNPRVALAATEVATVHSTLQKDNVISPVDDAVQAVAAGTGSLADAVLVAAEKEAPKENSALGFLDHLLEQGLPTVAAHAPPSPATADIASAVVAASAVVTASDASAATSADVPLVAGSASPKNLASIAAAMHGELAPVSTDPAHVAVAPPRADVYLPVLESTGANLHTPTRESSRADVQTPSELATDAGHTPEERLADLATPSSSRPVDHAAQALNPFKRDSAGFAKGDEFVITGLTVPVPASTLGLPEHLVGAPADAPSPIGAPADVPSPIASIAQFADMASAGASVVAIPGTGSAGVSSAPASMVAAVDMTSAGAAKGTLAVAATGSAGAFGISGAERDHADAVLALPPASSFPQLPPLPQVPPLPQLPPLPLQSSLPANDALASSDARATAVSVQGIADTASSDTENPTHAGIVATAPLPGGRGGSRVAEVAGVTADADMPPPADVAVPVDLPAQQPRKDVASPADVAGADAVRVTPTQFALSAVAMDATVPGTIAATASGQAADAAAVPAVAQKDVEKQASTLAWLDNLLGNSAAPALPSAVHASAGDAAVELIAGAIDAAAISDEASASKGVIGKGAKLPAADAAKQHASESSKKSKPLQEAEAIDVAKLSVHSASSSEVDQDAKQSVAIPALPKPLQELAPVASASSSKVIQNAKQTVANAAPSGPLQEAINVAKLPGASVSSGQIVQDSKQSMVNAPSSKESVDAPEHAEASVSSTNNVFVSQVVEQISKLETNLGRLKELLVTLPTAKIKEETLQA